MFTNAKYYDEKSDFKKRVAAFTNEHSGELKNIPLFRTTKYKIAIEKDNMCDGGRYFCLVIEGRKILIPISKFNFIDIDSEQNKKIIYNMIKKLETLDKNDLLDSCLMVNKI